MLISPTRKFLPEEMIESSFDDLSPLPPGTFENSPSSSFKKRTMRRRSSSRITNANTEFPILVKGIDVEIAQSKINSIISKELELSLKSVPQITREFSRRSSIDYDSENSPNPMSYNPSIFRSDSSQEELNAEMLDTPDMPVSSKYSLGGEKYNIKQLRMLINRELNISAEELLELAIYDLNPRNIYSVPNPTNRIKGKKKVNEKKRDEENIKRALDELNELNSMIENLKIKKEQNLEELREYEIKKMRATKEGAEVRGWVRDLMQKVSR